MMGWVFIAAAYIGVAILVYLWWVDECIKIRKENPMEDYPGEVEEAGFFFAAMWPVLLPCYWIMLAIGWIAEKVSNHDTRIRK